MSGDAAVKTRPLPAILLLISSPVIVPSVISPVSIVVPRVAAIVKVSLPLSPVMVIPLPSVKLRVSPVASATGSVPLGALIVAKRF